MALSTEFPDKFEPFRASKGLNEGQESQPASFTSFLCKFEPFRARRDFSEGEKSQAELSSRFSGNFEPFRARGGLSECPKESTGAFPRPNHSTHAPLLNYTTTKSHLTFRQLPQFFR